MVLVVKDKNKNTVLNILNEHQYNPVIIGEVTNLVGVKIVS